MSIPEHISMVLSCHMLCDVAMGCLKAQSEARTLYKPGKGASSLKGLFAHYEMGVLFTSGMFWG